jgi:hypothetical protein
MSGPQLCMGYTFLLLVTPGGFEPPAYRLGGGRSILLSYGASCGVLRNLGPSDKLWLD